VALDKITLPDEDALEATYSARLKASDGWRRGRIAALAGGLVVGAVIGAAAAGPSGLVGGLVGALAGLGVWALALSRSARGHARSDAVAAWTTARGLTIAASAPAFVDTPLLRNGYRRTYGAAYAGTVQGHPVTLFTYTYVTRETRTTTSTDANGNTTTSTYEVDVDHDYTICRVALPHPAVPRLVLEQRGALSLRVFDKLATAVTDGRTVELESVEFDKRYRLTVQDATNEVALRRVFAPATIVWFLDHGPAHVEIEGGALVIPIAGHQGDPDDLDALLATGIDVADELGAQLAIA
jgi:hypothetical protein